MNAFTATSVFMTEKFRKTLFSLSRSDSILAYNPSTGWIGDRKPGEVFGVRVC